MEKKTLFLWGGIGLLGLLVLVMGFFWYGGRQVAEAPIRGESENDLVSDEATAIMVEERRSASIDDITASIVADLAEDEAALEAEEKAELEEVESGGAAINELGTSYDESAY